MITWFERSVIYIKVLLSCSKATGKSGFQIPPIVSPATLCNVKVDVSVDERLHAPEIGELEV